MKSIDTLIEDIYNLFSSEYAPDEHNVEIFAKRLANKIAYRINKDNNQKPTLRMSNIGTNCDRKLYYSINNHEEAEELTPQTKLKFLYGDILEELLLFMASEAGHNVELSQEIVETNGIVGHIDAIVDGELVDVKSAASYSFQKFKNQTLADDDKFGYIDQLNGYLYSLQNNSELINKTQAHFFVINKENGELCLCTIDTNAKDYDDFIEEKKQMLASDSIPDRAFEPVPEGKSGNLKLGTVCSYCNFKKKCYPDLRTFLYSQGPVFLTHVEKEPKVPEASKTNQDEGFQF